MEVWPWLVHRNPQFWDNPEVFNPERHNERLTPFSFIPFGTNRIFLSNSIAKGAGSRECIGRRLALYEGKVVIAMVMRHFNVAMSTAHTMQPQLKVTLRPANLLMHIIKRRELQ